MKIKRTIIISGVNLSEGGPRTVLTSILEYLDQSEYVDKYKIYALIHSKDLFKNIKNIELIEFPDVKSSWLKRIKFEYKDCLQISKQLNSYLWLSMHDITPNIYSEKRAVYCHNPSPFYKQNFINIFKSPKQFIYTQFYKELYRINIHRNNFVIVQQKWIKNEFVKFFKLNKKKIIVALPDQGDSHYVNNIIYKNNSHVFKFIYPAFPRDFKNFEVICKAVHILNKKSVTNFEVILTVNGSENAYSNFIFEKFKKLKEIKFIGLQPKEIIENFYNEVNCLIFPSKLETWGLPISEFKKYQKPMLVADLEYAYETVGDYDKVKYFNCEDEYELADSMEKLMNNQLTFNNKGRINYESPVCENWDELFKYLDK